MNPAGVIITYIDWSDWKQWFFNIPLFLFQLMFMVVGTAIGKIEWEETLDNRQHRSFLIMVSGLLLLIEFNISMYRLPYHWWSLVAAVFVGIIGILEYRCIRWRRVWRAAQASHVRLCLKKITLLGVFDEWRYINFGYPEANLEYWRLDQCDDKRFEYREPTFDPTPRFIQRMIRYAHDQVEKPISRMYDWLQLIFGYTANFIVWLFWWPLWGKEVIPWFNLPGAREVCISGVVACLWFGESVDETPDVAILRDEDTTFFEGYDGAVIPPCMVPISEKWRRFETLS